MPSDGRVLPNGAEIHFTDERITKAIETPLVRVQGDWSGAVDRVLAHKLQRWADGIVLEETDAIVACEGDSLERGEQVTVRRVSQRRGDAR